jgi:heme/copper-type cytochrome/quinol oxidase subunit 4
LKDVYVDDQASADQPSSGQPRSALIYCGLCGALNPSSNYYCAACGTTLVDAFHATEGLRVFERPDAASRLIEIVAAGSQLDVIEDIAAPSDYVRVRLPQGRLGYVRLTDVEALAGDVTEAPDVNAPNINTAARGCVTPMGAVGALALLIALSTLAFVLLAQGDRADTGVLAIVFCVTVVPILLLTIGLFLYARDREERLEAEE